MPDVRRWQAGIDAAGFELRLDSSLVVETDTGYLPVKMKGRDSGFEFDLSPVSDVLEAYPELKTKVAGRDRSANFRWGGHLAEMACALVASAILATLTDGLLFDPQEGTLSDSASAVNRTRSELAAAGFD
jgi:hypothetical protein